MRLCVYVDFENEDDLDWIRNRVVPVVETAVDEMKDEKPYRLDSSPESVEVSWDTEDDG